MKNIVFCISVCVLLTTTSVCFASDESTILFDDARIQDSCAYEVYENQFQDEMAKVNFLVNRVRYSDGTFVRNRQKYNGMNAGQWLDYKIDKLAHEFETVEEFIEKVASYSRRSGKSYYMIIDDVKYPMKDVFYNELDRLYKYERQLVTRKMNQQLETKGASQYPPEFISPSASPTLSLHKAK